MAGYPNISDELLKAILQGDEVEVDERLYAAQKTVQTALTDLETGTVPGGYIGIIMGLATNFDGTATFYLKVAEKDRWENGLMALALSKIAVGAGVDDEVAVLEYVGEGKEWKLQAKMPGGAAVQNYRLRVRYYKIDSKLTQVE